MNVFIGREDSCRCFTSPGRKVRTESGLVTFDREGFVARDRFVHQRRGQVFEQIVRGVILARGDRRVDRLFEHFLVVQRRRGIFICTRCGSNYFFDIFNDL